MRSATWSLARACLGGAVAVATAGGPAWSGRLTLDVGTGVSHVRVIQAWDSDDGLETLGLTPVAIGIGRSFGEHWSLGVRATGAWFSHQPHWLTVEGADVRKLTGPRRWYFSQLLGLALQGDLREDLAVGLTAGVSFFGARPISVYLDRGFGVAARLSRPLWTQGNHAVTAAWELQSTIFANYEVILGSVLFVEWRRR